jgi:SAM-dependent methyltransferase
MTPKTTAVPSLSRELAVQYARRFADTQDYRTRVWQVLTGSFFQPMIPPDAAVLDLGCGYGDFINHIRARAKHAIDLNPDAVDLLKPDVRFHLHDAAQPWPVPERSLDVVFSSNFFEHLPSKPVLQQVVQQAFRSLKPGGRLICMGPNVRHLPGEYWDFWDHHTPLTDLSAAELLEIEGFRVTRREAKFLPYKVGGDLRAPMFFVGLYLRLPFAWRLFGKQFLIVAERPPE